jgi:hypothetical protein
LSTEERTPRQLVAEAGGLSFGEVRRHLLQEAIQSTAGPDPDSDAAETRAVALAMLAQQDPDYLTEADQALDRAATTGVETAWTQAHLAEAWWRAGRPAEALATASAVNGAFFDHLDLHWRTVQLAEIRAAALLTLGRLDEGLDLARDVCGELARRGDEDDLASPVFLVHAALALITATTDPAGRAGCAALDAVASSIEVEEWFSTDLADRIRETLLDCPA